MIKLISIIFLINLLSNIVFAQYFLIGQCLVVDDVKGELVYPVKTSLVNGGQYRFFKPEVQAVLPQPKTYFTPETNIALYSGISWNKLSRCD
jgi:hypothetical protein